MPSPSPLEISEIYMRKGSRLMDFSPIVIWNSSSNSSSYVVNNFTPFDDICLLLVDIDLARIGEVFRKRIFIFVLSFSDSSKCFFNECVIFYLLEPND
jgi:uncharacterized membrane protein